MSQREDDAEALWEALIREDLEQYDDRRRRGLVRGVSPFAFIIEDFERLERWKRLRAIDELLKEIP